MDPAAFGTTIIGLETVRRDDVLQPRAALRHRRPRPRLAHARRRLAEALRGAAELISPAPFPAR